jgi:hypothetical protein
MSLCESLESARCLCLLYFVGLAMQQLHAETQNFVSLPLVKKDNVKTETI